MVTALYAAILSLIMIWLSTKVIAQRKAGQIKYADGGHPALIIARSAQSNAVEYIPITLILMALAEYNGALLVWIHVLGVLFVVGRIAHARAILSDTLPWRVRGMMLTFGVILALAITNLIYLPYERLW